MKQWGNEHMRIINMAKPTKKNWKRKKCIKSQNPFNTCLPTNSNCLIRTSYPSNINVSPFLAKPILIYWLFIESDKEISECLDGRDFRITLRSAWMNYVTFLFNCVTLKEKITSSLQWEGCILSEKSYYNYINHV